MFVKIILWQLPVYILTSIAIDSNRYPCIASNTPKVIINCCKEEHTMSVINLQPSWKHFCHSNTFIHCWFFYHMIFLTWFGFFKQFLWWNFFNQNVTFIQRKIFWTVITSNTAHTLSVLSEIKQRFTAVLWYEYCLAMK